MAEGFDKAGPFAHRVGIGATAYSQYENGIRLSLDAAIKIANRVPGLTVDYLVRGREEGMPAELRQRIERAKAQEEAEAKKKITARHEPVSPPSGSLDLLSAVGVAGFWGNHNELLHQLFHCLNY